MRIQVAIAQINCTVGDLEGNCTRIMEAAQNAYAAGADILLTPELSIAGYPPEDLLLRPAFYERCDAVLSKLIQFSTRLPGLHLVVGHPIAREGNRYNAASVVSEGRLVGTYRKHDLPNYDVFDEQRYFTPDQRPLVFTVKGVSFGVNICEDTWFRYAPSAARAAGADVLLILNASPYHMNKEDERLAVMRENVTPAGMSLVYCNLVGGQDELVFDGGSFVLDANGNIAAFCSQFEESLKTVQFDGSVPLAEPALVDLELEAQVYSALVLGVRDYIGKNGFPGALLGLSGGIDSALTLAIAVDAIGADKVRTVMMPSPYTADISWIDAREMAQRVGVRYDEWPINSVFESFLGSLEKEFAGLAQDTTEENIQARIRGTLLMALSNKSGSIVLTTGNKSEYATGYCTLYGDMAGGFAVLKDIAKTMVYRLSNYRNRLSAVIPQRIIDRAPSAELRPNQTDQDSLPPYDILDGIMELYMQENRSVSEILAAGYEAAHVQHVIRLLRMSEYKRRQAPVGIRVTHRGFGRDWRYPITSRFVE